MNFEIEAILEQIGDEKVYKKKISAGSKDKIS